MITGYEQSEFMRNLGGEKKAILASIKKFSRTELVLFKNKLPNFKFTSKKTSKF